MKILVDMNLSPEWVRVLEGEGWKAIHWSRIGNPGAPDEEILLWAKSNAYIVF
jgi:predicted nuclease of predicted toxin-antitoxin system